MVFPQTPPPVKGQLFINGAWVDVTSRIRGSGDITIYRGRANEQGRVTASSCNFTLNNRNGDFSDRNPMSPYYQQLPRNLPARIGVTDAAGMSLFCGNYYNTLARAQTADKAALDIVGDIDIRMDVNPSSWRPSQYTMLASKYVSSGNQCSWQIGITTGGFIVISWSVTGSTTTTTIFSTVAISSTAGRTAIKVFLDVDNGAAGNTVTFSTASTIGGSYSTLGSPVITAGVTSIFSSSADLAVGNGANGVAPFTSTSPFAGRYYGFQLRNSAGTLVANADFTAQAADATSWADGLGNTWTVSGLATRLTADSPRYIGELSSMPVRWDTTGRDVYNPVNVAGIIQRLTQGVSPLHSPIYRNFNQRNLTGWYPGEDDLGSTTIASAIPKVRNAAYVDVTPSSDTELLGSDGVLVFNSANSYMSGAALDTGNNTGTVQFLCYFRFPSIPVSPIELVSVYMIGGSSLSKFTITITSTTYQVDAYDLSGASVLSAGILHGAGATPDQWISFKLDLVQSGGNINWAMGWYPILSSLLFGSSGSFVGTVGRISGFIIWNRTGRDGMRLAHTYMSQVAYDNHDTRYIGASNGYVNETALTRLIRLCEEESIPFVYRGVSASTEVMGRQLPKEFMELVYECVDIDGGVLFEPREMIGLGYYARHAIRNVTGPQLAYSGDIWGTVEPTDDDQLIRNDVTVTRPFGSTGRATLDVGRMSTLPTSSGGSGRYAVNPTLNAYLDSRLAALAQYLVQLGTVDEARWVGLATNLARSALVADSTKSELIKALDIGGNLGLTGLPSFLPRDNVDMLVQGIQEVIANSDKSREWSFRFNTSPYDPYRINDLTSSSTSRYQAGGTTGNTLTSLITTSTTSFTVTTAAGSTVFATSAAIPAIFPLSVKMNGEQMTVSAITSATSPQTFTISARGANNILRAHNAGSVIDIVNKFDATL